MNKKYISYIIDGITAGFFLCIGCAVSMSSDTKALGAFLFSLGLFAIITFKLGLYTGKAGYMAVNSPSYIIEVILTIIGNTIGTAVGGNMLRATRFGVTFTEKAITIMEGKLMDGSLSIFVLAIFCGVLMFTAVDGNKCLSEKNNYIGALFITVLPVMVFIICGFNHCVADLAYFFISGCANIDKVLVYFVLVILGNAVGCMLLPLMRKIKL